MSASARLAAACPTAVWGGVPDDVRRPEGARLTERIAVVRAEHSGRNELSDEGSGYIGFDPEVPLNHVDRDCALSSREGDHSVMEVDHFADDCTPPLRTHLVGRPAAGRVAASRSCQLQVAPVAVHWAVQDSP